METNNPFSRKYAAHLAAVLTFCALLLVSEYLFHLNYRHQKGLQLSDVFSHASTLRQNIEREINTAISLTSGLALFVSINPDFTDGDFAKAAQELLNQAPHLRAVALARDNVITSLYPPREGDDKALSLHLLEIPEQKAAVLRAMNEKTPVIAGPVNLALGGEGFISRVPIFLAGRKDKYWGLADIVISTEDFYRASGLSAAGHDVQYALRGRDGLGDRGEIFYGPDSLFNDRDALQLAINLPSGNWILAAKSTTSASTSSPLFLLLRGFGIAVSLSVSGLVFALLRSYRHIQYLALHDPLTGLANRRLFFEHVKQAISSAVRNDGKFAIVYMDLDNFKPVNDTYGHKHGDQVLREIAVRVTEGLRHSDIIARIGGDEFILLMQDTKSSEDVPSLIEKISQLISQPIILDNGVSIEIQASIGTAVFPDDGKSADELIRHADRKMYKAKYANRR